MSGLNELLSGDAVRRVLSVAWDGSPVVYDGKFELDRRPLACPLLQRLDLPHRSVILVQPLRVRKRRSRSSHPVPPPPYQQRQQCAVGRRRRAGPPCTSRCASMSRSKSSGSSTLYIDDDEPDDDDDDDGNDDENDLHAGDEESLLREDGTRFVRADASDLIGCPLEWTPGGLNDSQSMHLLESPPYDSQINSPCSPYAPPYILPSCLSNLAAAGEAGWEHQSSHQQQELSGMSPAPDAGAATGGWMPSAPLRALPADDATSLLHSLSIVLAANSVAPTSHFDGPPREVPPIWIPCDGADPQYTAFLGQHRAEGIASRVNVSCRGPVESKDLPTYGCILRKHFWGLSQHHCHTTTQLSSRFDVLSVYSLSEPRFSSSVADIMQIDCSWNGRATHLLQPPSIDAVCHLTIQISPGNEKSPCRLLYKELRHLQNLVNCLSSGEMAWLKDFSAPPFMDKVKNLCKNSASGAMHQTNSVRQSALDAAWDMADFNICIETVVASKRQPVDFTDELWNVICGCANYQELKDALAYVFSQVTAGQMKPHLASNNHTQMAHILHDMSARLSAEPALQGITPLTLVAEMGLQKLQRDYLHIFSGLELASPEQLAPFFRAICGPGLLRAPADLNTAVSELFRLQGALDMVMLCKTNLHLPIHYLSGYVREALKQLAGHCNQQQQPHQLVPHHQDISCSHVDSSNCVSDKAHCGSTWAGSLRPALPIPAPPAKPTAAAVRGHRFRFPLKVALVRAILDSLPPTEWTASIKSRQGTYAAHTITHISQRAPFGHIVRDTMFEAHYNPRDPDYYCTIVSCTQDKLR